MRIAVLVTGQPRFIEQGSWWLNNRTFDDTCDVDYYCYFWSNGDPDLVNKIQNTFNPKRTKIVDYDKVWNRWTHQVSTANATEKNWDPIHKIIRQHACFGGTSDWKRWLEQENNILRSCPGQYFSAADVFDLVPNIDEYDLVIKTRSDCMLMPPNSGWTWVKEHIEHRSKSLKDDPIIWIQKSKLTKSNFFILDHYFYGLPKDMKQFFNPQLKQNLFNLVTKDKLAFADLAISNPGKQAHGLHLHEIIWSKLQMYTNDMYFMSMDNIHNTRSQLIRETIENIEGLEF